MKCTQSAPFSNCEDLLLNCLCPPGNGVYTVHTAQQHRQQLQQQLYHSSDPKQIEAAWHKQLQQLDSNTPWLLGVCSDAGGGIQRGANWGPLFIRNTFYTQYPNPELIDLGDIRVIPHLLSDELLNELTLENCRHALYQDPNSPYPVSPLSITEAVASTLYHTAPHARLLALGGDHSVSYPLVKSFLEYCHQQQKRAGILHFDAHTDLLPSRLGIAVTFGSWVYHMLPLLPEPCCLVQVGIRSTAHPQEYWESTLGVKQYWAAMIQQTGIEATIDAILAHYQSLNIDTLYVTFDIDCLDHSIASSTGTPEPDGLSVSDAVSIIEACAAHFDIQSADLVEVAPFVNIAQTETHASTTLNAASTLLQTLLKALAHSPKAL